MTAPLYLIPGWSLGRGPLRAFADALDARFIDLPGYGERAPEADFAQTVASIAASLPAGSCLAGWSLGAQVALAVAASAPEKVSRLILIAGTPSFMQRADWPHAMPAAQLAAFRQAIIDDVAQTFPRFVGSFNRGDSAARQVTQDILALADPLPSGEILCHGLDWLRDVDLRPQLARVTQPVLLIQGAADPLMPLAAAEALRDLLPQATLASLPGCAHAPFLSQPAACLQLARDFLARND